MAENDTKTEMQVKVPAGEAGSYKVQIGSGILEAVWADIQKEFEGKQAFIVTDANVAEAGHLETLLAGKTIPDFVIEPAGEVSKNIDTVVKIVETMERAYLGRDSVVAALGGGTVGDIGAFAASIFKRGVPVVQIPTTTVAQADSGIGGKAGVDSSVSKNAFGSFWHPAAVYVDVETLKSLDNRQYRAGLVESVKHALIMNDGYFDYIEENIDALLSRDSEVLVTLAKKNCRIKAAVVEEDPKEKNKRRILNYGHTIGHAVESVSGFKLLHGEAVAIGIMAAGLIEKEMGLGDGARLERIGAIFEKLSVPVKIPPEMEKGKLIETIKRDKKAVKGWPRFVLIETIGKVHCQGGQYAVKVEAEVIEKVLEQSKG
jgi:3-dehydroquinate synthase